VVIAGFLAAINSIIGPAWEFVAKIPAGTMHGYRAGGVGRDGFCWWFLGGTDGNQKSLCFTS